MNLLAFTFSDKKLPSLFRPICAHSGTGSVEIGPLPPWNLKSSTLFPPPLSIYFLLFCLLFLLCFSLTGQFICILSIAFFNQCYYLKSEWAVPLYQVAQCRLHVISAQCVAHGLHTTAPGPLEHICWRRFAAQWGDCKNFELRLSMRLLLLLLLWSPEQRLNSHTGKNLTNTVITTLLTGEWRRRGRLTGVLWTQSTVLEFCENGQWSLHLLCTHWSMCP